MGRNTLEGCFQPDRSTEGGWDTNGTASVDCYGKRHFQATEANIHNQHSLILTRPSYKDTQLRT